jgi:tight adherence protein B
MLPALVMFLIGSGVVIGGYAAYTYVPDLIARRQMDRRLHDVSIVGGADPVSEDSTILKNALRGPLPALERLAAKTRAGSWLAKLIEQSGVRTTPSHMIVATLISAALLGFAASLTQLPFSALVGGLVGAVIPIGWLRHCRSSRLKKFEEQFPEALDLLSRAIRAGHAFQTALGMVGDDLTAPVGPEFKKTFDEQNFGLPLRDVLNQLSERVPLLDVRFFVTAVLIQRDTGGNLSEILDNLAHVVRERFKIQRQVRVHTAHGRFTGYVLLGLPVALSIALSIINPEHMHALFHEHMGQMMLLGAVVMQTIGFFWIRQVIKIEV